MRRALPSAMSMTGNVVASPLRELFQSASGVTASDIPQQLLAYGNALHADSRWPLAADVYRTLLQFADSPRAVRAIRDLGRSCRTCTTGWTIAPDDGRSRWGESGL